MITLITILLVIGIVLAGLLLLTRNANRDTKPKTTYNSIIRNNRILSYLLFIACSIIFPFIATIISILITDSRIEGMTYGYSLPFLILNFGFAFILINSRIRVRLLCGIIVSIISVGLLCLIMYSGILSHELFGDFDSYGIWRLIISFNVVSIITWEIAYRIIERRNYAS